MKILYAIQGTGNGHVARAREIIPYLQEYGDVDIVLSGTQAEVELGHDIKYKFLGFGFVFGKSGGVDFAESWRRADFGNFIKECRSLPVKSYDIVISDFEPVTSWACKLRRKKCMALSHQSAYKSPKTPKIKGFHWGRIILNHYAPADDFVAFHFEKYDDFIRTPVIRKEIRNMEPTNLGHYTVYLPAYSDEFILKQTKNFPEVPFQIFSKHSKNFYTHGNTDIFPINNDLFQKSLATCRGLLTGGGFEGPAEALFLSKKLLAVPMAHQYEQQCNALALEKMGVPVIWNEAQFPEKLKNWIFSDQKILVNFPDETHAVIARLISAAGK